MCIRDSYTALERGTPAVRAALDPWGPRPAARVALDRRLKDHFDPGHRLAPGRDAGGHR